MGGWVNTPIEIGGWNREFSEVVEVNQEFILHSCSGRYYGHVNKEIGMRIISRWSHCVYTQETCRILTMGTGDISDSVACLCDSLLSGLLSLASIG